ncbi:MAG: calcium/sodium antiporter [Deltaproteobacteria bacterium]|nr:calcium/sodium antiporter [Deltaproteobacteria bacterium]
MLVYLLFVAGFFILIKGADVLVEGSSSLARRFNVSDLVIGLTVVAFGTSTPELFVNIIASAKGNVDIAIGNVLGSNISNIFLILGISALIFPLKVTRGTVWKEIPFSLLAIIALGIMANGHLINNEANNIVTRSDGLLLLLFFAIFLYYSYSIATEMDGMNEQTPVAAQSLIKSVLMVTLGFGGLTLGGKWIVDGAVKLATSFGMSENLIGLTIVAVGTSLPELATSASAAYKKKADIAVGNVVGSNIFNILFVLGISSVIKPLPFALSSNIDIGVVIFASLLLFFSMFTLKKQSLDRWEGAGFLVFYLCYIALRLYMG